MMTLHVSRGLCVVVALVAYIACARIARRSSFYGGGTVVLSWIGLIFPCIGWIAMIQGWNALRRASVETPSPAAAANVKAYTIWTVVYVIALVAASVLLRSTDAGGT
jgi:hypothetical protein